jgi:hypothetical protein
MPKRKAQTKKASADTSFLSQLALLRDFVGGSFSESDLSGCLRQCGFNTQQAAEKLMTGEYKSNGNTAKSFIHTPSAAKSTSNSVKTPANKRHCVTPASALKKSAAQHSNASSVKKQLASISSNNKAPSDDGLWLCERWIVGLSTTKNGRFQYQESLQISHSLTGPAIIRFRGSSIEGTLRPNIGALLTPLLREATPLISMEVHALMQETGVPIGGDVPLCLR